jgi:alkylhydroperoxidase/carboxymuconolactone decarboxylase family protein YurZ
MSDSRKLDPKQVMDEYVRDRGDIFPEFHFMASIVPETVHAIHQMAGYILRNDNQTTPDQELSTVMRELIATCYLSSKGDERFAANHVRRLYRMGVTNRVLMEAAEAMAPVTGHSSISHVAQAILLAHDPNYTFGKMPEGGEPSVLKPFPEMQLGRDKLGGAVDSLRDTLEWKEMAAIDPELASRAARLYDHCLAGDHDPGRLLGPGARELVAVAALCARGEVQIASAHIRRAYAYGVSRRKVLEAISCLANMTGIVTVQIGIRAIRLAEADGDAQ